MHEKRIAPANSTTGLGAIPVYPFEPELPGIDESEIGQWHHVIVTWNRGQNFTVFKNFNVSLLGGVHNDTDGANYISVGGHPS